MNKQLFEPQFTTKEAAEAAGMNVKLLRSWIERGFLIDVEPEEPDGTNTFEALGRPGRGKQLLFSFNQVMGLALAKVQTDFGFKVAQATLNSLRFTDMGSSWISLGDGPQERPTTEPHRKIGALFEQVGGPRLTTWMAVSPQDSYLFYVKPGQDFRSVFHTHEFKSALGIQGEPRGFLMINVSEVWDQTANALGIEADAA